MPIKPIPFDDLTGLALRLKSVVPEEDLLEIAKTLRLSRTQVVKRWRNAEAEPPLQFLVFVAEKYRVNLDWLLTGKEPEARADVQAVVECPVVRHHDPGDKRLPEASAVVPLSMAWSVIESETTTAQALLLNIQEFYEKVYGPPPHHALYPGTAHGGMDGAGDQQKTPEGGKGRPVKDRRKANA